MNKVVFCIAQSIKQATLIVDRLKMAGFSKNAISVLLQDKSGTKDPAHEERTKVLEDAAIGGAVGIGVGAVLGWLAGIGGLAILGGGPLIVAGPIMGALSGAAVGAAAGSIIGTLVGLGIPEYEISKRYEGKVKGGSALISVHTESSEARSEVRKIFEKAADVEDISSTGETGIGD